MLLGFKTIDVWFFATHMEIRTRIALAAAPFLQPPLSPHPFLPPPSVLTARGAGANSRACISTRRAKTNALLAPPLEIRRRVIPPRLHTFALSTAAPLVASGSAAGSRSSFSQPPSFRRRVCFPLRVWQCRFLRTVIAACSVRQHFMATPVPNPAFETDAVQRCALHGAAQLTC